MSAHSHVTRIQMMERTRNPKQPTKYKPSSQGTPSILSSNNGAAESVLSSGSKPGNESVLSTGSRNMNPRQLKQNDMYRSKSQEALMGVMDDQSFRASNSMLSRTYAPSLRSLNTGMGQRATSRASLASMSRSLGASKASIASLKSTIQQEYHDKKVKRKLNSPWFGVARKPFIFSVLLFILSFLFLFIGLTILILRGFGNLFLSHDVGDVIGPAFIAAAIIALAVAIKFITDAYKIGARERRSIKFRADNSNMVEVTKGPRKKLQNEMLVTGTNTKEAISRTLVTTSRTDIRDV